MSTRPRAKRIHARRRTLPGSSSTSARCLKVCLQPPAAPLTADFAKLPAAPAPKPAPDEAPASPAATFDPEAVPPPSPAPTTLVAWAVLVLNTPSPVHKVAYTRHAAHAFRSGACRVVGGGRWRREGDAWTWALSDAEQPPVHPPRLDNEKQVAPGLEGKRGKGGTEKSRIALLHSLANIEQWAIDLAWDIIARGPRLFANLLHTEPGGDAERESLPVQYFADFVKVALDEAKHFTLLQRRLLELGSYFGALPVHHGLWQSALETSEDLLARLSIIHLVHEARGLDVNPVTIKKFENAGDLRSVEVRRYRAIWVSANVHAVSPGDPSRRDHPRLCRPPLAHVSVSRSPRASGPCPGVPRAGAPQLCRQAQGAV